MGECLSTIVERVILLADKGEISIAMKDYILGEITLEEFMLS